MFKLASTIKLLLSFWLCGFIAYAQTVHASDNAKDNIQLLTIWNTHELIASKAQEYKELTKKLDGLILKFRNVKAI